MDDGRARIKSVVVATDLSVGAANAAGRAAVLPLAPGAALSLVHVLPEALPPEVAGAAHERAAAALQEAAAALRRAAIERGAAAPDVECEVRSGAPHVEIVRHARARAADLVVVGRHGRHALAEARVGSTAERVVRNGDVPVLLVNGAASGPYRRAVVALDLADTSRRVANLAVSLLPGDVQELTLVHAYELPFEGWLAEAAQEELRRRHAEEARASANELAAALGFEGMSCRIVVREGDPRLAVLHQAVQDRSDLIVLGTHARAGLAHVLLGSVAEWLIRAAPCDVALTRPAPFTFELP